LRSTSPKLEETFIASERENIRALYLPKLSTKVVEEGGRIAGFICLLRREVAALFVHPNAQGHGIGTRLLRSQTAPLTLEVFAANTRARAFYAARGFREVGQRVHEETALPLRCLALDEHP
jgi:ribosomal protein S18 acetylase RimI-like enzyme